MRPENSPSALQPETSGLLSDARWRLSLRVADSPYFRKAPRLREFLLYVCEKTLTGCSHEVSELQIGIKVFGRRTDYNRGDDNIVRVEARELRKRLKRYFCSQGKREDLVIKIPKGTYIPVFEMRGGNLYPPPIKPQSPHSSLIWRLMFSPKQETYVVVNDNCLALIQDLTHIEFRLRDYLERTYLGSLASYELREIAQRRFTGFADVVVVSKILRLNPVFQDRISIRFARDLAVQDVKTRNLILIGTRRANPWAELYENVLNFSFEFDTRLGRPLYCNKSPRPGEVERYIAGGENGDLDETYALVAFLPNIANTGNVLLIQGTTGLGTEGAGEYITNPFCVEQLAERLELRRKAGRFPYFEVLLRVRTVGGTPKGITYVSHRILADHSLAG